MAVKFILLLSIALFHYKLSEGLNNDFVPYTGIQNLIKSKWQPNITTFRFKHSLSVSIFFFCPIFSLFLSCLCLPGSLHLFLFIYASFLPSLPFQLQLECIKRVHHQDLGNTYAGYVYLYNKRACPQTMFKILRLQRQRC